MTRERRSSELFLACSHSFCFASSLTKEIHECVSGGDCDDVGYDNDDGNHDGR